MSDEVTPEGVVDEVSVVEPSESVDVEDDVTDAEAPGSAEDAEEESDSESEAGAADEVEDDSDGEDAAEGSDDSVEGAAGGPTRSKRDETLTNEGEIAADYIEGLLDIADLDGDIDTYNEGGRAHVSVITESDVLVGKTGDVLEALQELCRLAVMTETGHRSRLMLDIAGHRDRRRGQLQALAAEAIAEVVRSGDSVRLSPMNPFERKIVHDVIAAGGLVSESEGEEPNRRVVVMPKA